ncbi:MAG: hypothetical protein CME70_19760 [Halobacteriovorax sp.]|nr:hypothetical protein [Halobacteriovorax sp.]|tara:strand:- start:14295 stop:15341 length:1047 start_codon:yes stop_codon:yes gene_type:complete
MKNKIIISVLALGLSSQAFGFGRNSGIEELVESYQDQLKALQKVESSREKERSKAIANANSSVKQLEAKLASYDKSLKNYENRYIAPTKKRIEAKKSESANLRQKVKEYEVALEQAIKDRNFSTPWYSKKKGADDYQNLITSAQKSIQEAESKQKEYEASLKSYEQQKKEYEGTISKKKEELVAAQTSFGEAQKGLETFQKASKEYLGAKVAPTLHLAVGQMIQNGKNASLEAELMLRDLDSLATKLGVSKSELKNVFTENPELREKIGNTALGSYVNSQIANAMGSVCEYQTMCAAKGADDVNKLSPEIVKKSLDHLNDKQRGAKIIEALGEKVERDVAAEATTLGK